jgi:retron-type reverse transcriptase
MKKQKVHSLTGRITPEVMLAAFKAVKRNRGAAGVDKVSIQMFEANLADNLRVLMQDLKNGSFEPKPLRRVFIPKNETEFRPLGIPTVKANCTSPQHAFGLCSDHPCLSSDERQSLLHS